MKSALPFGPFLALGATIAVFAGHPILQGYLNR
jgi:prepilin signal peptidase PulO-like enzyme (type II secretory pathway)